MNKWSLGADFGIHDDMITHADNVGYVAAIMVLSHKKAQAVGLYLMSKGVFQIV